MKRKIFSIQSVLLLGGMLLLSLTGCTDKDTTAPSAELAGDNPMNITLNDQYVEPGFSELYDNRDDTTDLEIEITHEIELLEGDYLNLNGEYIFLGAGATIETGEFIVTYTIKDKEGNTTTLTRTVIIENTLDKFTRAYTVTKDNLTDDTVDDHVYETDVEAHENLNNRLVFNNFSDFNNVSLSVYADVSNDSVYIPEQRFPLDENYLIEGNLDAANNGYAGSITTSNYGIEIFFTASNTGSAAQKFHEVYVKL